MISMRNPLFGSDATLRRGPGLAGSACRGVPDKKPPQ